MEKVVICSMSTHERVIHPLSDAKGLPPQVAIRSGFVLYRPVKGEAYEDLAATLSDRPGVETVYTSSREVLERQNANEGRMHITTEKVLKMSVRKFEKQVGPIPLSNFLLGIDKAVPTLHHDFEVAIDEIVALPSRNRSDKFLIAGRIASQSLQSLLEERWRVHRQADSSVSRPRQSKWSPIVPLAHVATTPEGEEAVGAIEVAQSFSDLRVTLGTAGCRLAN